MLRRILIFTRPCSCTCVRRRHIQNQKHLLYGHRSLLTTQSRLLHTNLQINNSIASPVSGSRNKQTLTFCHDHDDDYGQEKGGSFNSIYMKSLAFGAAILLCDQQSLKAAEKEPNVQEKKTIWLLQACKDNDLQAIHRLIKDGVDVNTKHNLGWTPLMVAAMNGHFVAVKTLLDAKANPDIPDSYSQAGRMAKETGLSKRQVQQIRDDEFSNLLTGHNFRGSTALHYAALANDIKITTALIKAGADPLIVNAQGYKPSQFAAKEHADLFEKWEMDFEDQRKQKEAEMRRRFPLEKRFQQQLVGQEGAINVVASAVRRKENGWFNDDHPLVMLFLGSSGIGKTELAKQLAHYIHGDKRDGFIRIDMSEYQSKHEAAKFVGAPPGYVGHEDGGQLTERLKACPSAVVLFDEVDKAHPDVLATLLHLFDEGRITDGRGRKIECNDAIFIMTANIGNEEISQHALELRESAKDLSEGKLAKNSDIAEGKDEHHNSGQTELSREFKDTIIHPILKRAFKREEFIGRINEIVYFLPFNKEELNRLVTRQLNFWAGKAYSVHKVELKWESSVVEVLARGYDVRYGARSIIYEVERQVISKLASLQERQLITTKDKLMLKVNDGKVVVEKMAANNSYRPIL